MHEMNESNILCYIWYLLITMSARKRVYVSIMYVFLYYLNYDFYESIVLLQIKIYNVYYAMISTED